MKLPEWVIRHMEAGYTEEEWFEIVDAMEDLQRAQGGL
jgi:hypothetical protein